MFPVTPRSSALLLLCRNIDDIKLRFILNTTIVSEYDPYTQLLNWLKCSNMRWVSRAIASWKVDEAVNCGIIHDIASIKTNYHVTISSV